MQWAAIGAVAGCGLVLAATVLNLLVSWPAPAAPAKMAHAQRPATMPKGTPMSSAAAARTMAFHATTAWTWRLVSPRVFSAARSTYAARYVAC